jgi:shikimate dehydrogenase
VSRTADGTEEAWRPTGSTRLAAVIGDPVRHSLSPILHNAAFRALDLDWVYVALEVGPGGAPAAIEGVRALGIDGLNVTMPHKAAVAAAVDRVTPAADALLAVNTVVRTGGELVGHNTDGDGFVASVVADLDFDPAGRRCVVIGAGGAARAVVRGLADAGAADVVVVARRAGQAEAAAHLGGGVGRAGRVEDVGDADLVVNATPVGMGGPAVGDGATPPDDPAAHPVDPTLIGPGQLVVDLVYDPLTTPFMAAARARGAVAANGLGMLLHQAALAFRLWTAEEAPLDVMAGAVLTHVAGRAELLT